ncbi:putative short-chain dehydrogenase/reductase family 42E member 2 [Dunckerocampus dactyliophorus]|uniref:putative short-chain dehydrogenase/reductase family 42E member 2 n=1 Tax=Dunckerocampus dactyliophorus TaxID=161453 RepID=UPI002404F9BB|nr:putative short-chain dehydrogenase/reductase family 42E member 2 [Dunckerocampus dactyliophorus]XP_054615435.1 putative short-chain dehydrogenase/reductase family 42E member 2 [Dunckerocampus dactyliophorus]XP_054615436.1 putative short-chain dehydrogenase/reductase family 42E member 2 [Dunckerocampus dactyliophorus]
MDVRGQLHSLTAWASMELCGPNMSESGGSLCQVKQLPCHDVSLCRLQVSGQALHNLSPRTHPSSWVKHAPLALRHRVSGAMASTCSSPECAASKVGESGSSAEKVLVTGGGGYFGLRLGRALASQGMSVILLDMNKPPSDIPDGAVFYQSDIRDYSSLFDLCDGVDCVFHTASYGMSGPEQLRKEQVESVNVGGTHNVINVCKERSIHRLVYTSTINAVFAGEPIEDGDEASVACVPPDMHVDHYSRTKAIAEQIVLSANGCPLKGGGLLRTCVLRPCGIYGPEERRHLHRVMVNVERRLFSFRFGNPQARMNWVHVDNLVLAHVLAAEALTTKKSCIASGQAYFINDGLSVNLFEWLTPLFEKLGYSRPLINLPVSLVYSAAILVEYLHIFLRPVIEVPLLFTRNEVRNIAVSHTFKIDKARQDLGYRPKSYSLVDSVEQYLHSRKACSGSPLVHWRTPRLHRPHMVVLLMAFSMLLLMLSWVHGSILTYTQI